MQIYTGKTEGTREKKQDFRVDKGRFCHTYGTGRGVTADNIFASPELANLLLPRNVTLVGKLGKRVKQSRYRPGVAQRVPGS
jgi:hypothetical protein